MWELLFLYISDGSLYHLPRKGTHENLPPSTPPDAEVLCYVVTAHQRNTQHKSVFYSTIHLNQWPLPRHLALVCWASSSQAPDLTPQIAVHCNRVAWLLPTICSNCVEPSVCKTGRPWFPFSLGLVSLFSGASLLPGLLLGLGSGSTMGFLKWQSWGWGCRAHLLQAWGPSIINGAMSTGDSSDIQLWPKDSFWKINKENFSVLKSVFLSPLFFSAPFCCICSLLATHSLPTYLPPRLFQSVSYSPSFCFSLHLSCVWPWVQWCMLSKLERTWVRISWAQRTPAFSWPQAS